MGRPIYATHRDAHQRKSQREDQGCPGHPVDRAVPAIRICHRFNSGERADHQLQRPESHNQQHPRGPGKRVSAKHIDSQPLDFSPLATYANFAGRSSARLSWRLKQSENTSRYIPRQYRFTVSPCEKCRNLRWPSQKIYSLFPIATGSIQYRLLSTRRSQSSRQLDSLSANIVRAAFRGE